ncbi:mariner Mos1 transposase [Trichonephila clavipes]|nr:mariner Mos1 transposase [Trichonephila clavipes]
MIFFFFDHKSTLLVEFLERETTINAQRYQATLHNLRPAVKSKCPDMLSKGAILPHYITHPCTANAMKKALQQFRWERLEQLPYCPGLSLCDFHVSGPLKLAIHRH